MENVNFQPSGEEIERALMDLGPLLGVSIKEEVPDEPPDPNAPPTQPLNNANMMEGGGSGAGTSSGTASGTDGAPGGGEGGEGKEGADSLASPAAARASPSAARCVFCTLPLTQAEGTPKLMECLHSTCESCLKTKVDEKQSASRDFLGAERITIMCPSCRLQCQPSNMIDQHFVIEKMTLEAGTNGGPSGAQQCNSCDDTEPATSYCVDCAEFICDNCVHAHQRLKITKDHTIKGKEEAVAELQAAQRSVNDMFCSEHPQERLSLFCETCDRLTCRDCQLHHHRDHKYQFSTEMAAQARTSLSSLLSEVSYKRVLLSSAMKVIADRQQLIADKKKALVHEITQTVVKLTNAINSRGKQLVLRLNEVCDAKQRTLAEKKAALEQLAGITDHCVSFVGGALSAGSDGALLAARPLLHHHLHRIKQRRADIPNPEIPVRITLQLDKLPDLLRVLGAVGAIVVDGKVDQPAQPPAQQPAQPPAQQQAPPQGPYVPPHSSPHSAVVALQHHAMHQQYVQSGGAGAGAVTAWGGGRRHAGATPLRHAHVSSTTHPHQLHGLQDVNLRGLLGPRALRPPHHHQHPAYHHMMGAYASGAFGGGAGASNSMQPVGMGGAGMGAGPMGGGAMTNAAMGAAGMSAAGMGGGMGGSLPGGAAPTARRSAGPRTPSPAPPPPAYHQHAAKWHIPQQNANGAFETNASTSSTGGGADFKIQLGRARSGAPAVVTSTNPKTPSPNLNGGASLELDKVCAESVQDLMATIAKLDSNGVQVLPEAQRVAPSPAPPVHSSTDPPAASTDPNEDWCAVCMDGGELMCCDKCPKVFHQYCHIPTIEKLPDESESWQCLLCVNFSSLEGVEWSRVAERVTLELYCQYELSLSLRAAPPHACLDRVRARLQPRHPRRYTHAAHFVADCRAVFRNAYAYNAPDSQTYKDAKRLEEFFDAQLLKLMPEYAYWSGEGEPPAKRPRPHSPPPPTL